jgi:hypothetical protein
VTECSKLISPLLSVRHSLSLQVTAILQNLSFSVSLNHKLNHYDRTTGASSSLPLPLPVARGLLVNVPLGADGPCKTR